METCPKLTPTQALLLRTAARRADGRVIPPANLRGGARVKAMTALMRREWIEASDGGFVLTDAGYAVAGRKRPAPPERAGAPHRLTVGLTGLQTANPANSGLHADDGEAPRSRPPVCAFAR